MKSLAIAIIVLLQFLNISYSIADTTPDITRGARLESDNCSACHAARFNGDSSAIYLREHRRVNNHNQLISQVEFCKNNLGLVWFDDQVMDVVEHLNKRYYHFKTPK